MKTQRLLRPVLLAIASVVFLAYVLSPIAWLISSSFQSEVRDHLEAAALAAAPANRCRTSARSSRPATAPSPTRTGARATPPPGAYIPSTAKNLLPAMGNSLIVAVTVVVLNLLVSVPAAYAMAKIHFVGRTSSIYLMLTTRVIPDIALVVPFFLFVRKLGLLDNLASLVITYLAITVPFSIFILLSYFESLPDELDKAARVDGCSRLQTLAAGCSCRCRCRRWWRWGCSLS